MEPDPVLKRKKPQRWLSTVVSIGVAAFIVVVLSHTITSNFDVLSAQPLTINWIPLFASFIVYIIDLWLAMWAWHRIVQRMLGVSNWQKNSKIYVNTLLARRLPGSIWHIVGRAQIYAEEGVPKSVSSMGGAVEFVVFFLSGGALYIALWPWLRESQFSMWVFVCLVPLGLLVLFPQVVVWLTAKVSRSQVSMVIFRRDLIEWSLLYILVWIVGGVLLFLIVNSFYVLPVSYLPRTIAAWTLSSMVGMIAVFTPAGLGVREITLSVLLLPFVIAPYNVIISIMARLVITAFDFVCAGSGYLYFRIRSKSHMGNNDHNLANPSGNPIVKP